MVILALGIGANTAMFSVVDGVLLKPLPFRDGHELVLVQQSSPQTNRPAVGVSIPELYDYRQHLKAIRDLVEYHSMSFTLLDRGDPDRVDTGVVSANFFDVLGMKPLHGRTFIDTDDDLGSEAVLVLSHAYWQEKFAGDKAVVGKVVEMNDRIHTIVGVLPAYPQYPRENDVYMPTSACPFRARAERRSTRITGPSAPCRCSAGCRRASGKTATTEIATVAATFDNAFPKEYVRLKEIKGNARVLQDALVSSARPMRYALAARRGSCCCSRARTSPTSRSHEPSGANGSSPFGRRSAQDDAGCSGNGHRKRSGRGRRRCPGPWTRLADRGHVVDIRRTVHDADRPNWDRGAVLVFMIAVSVVTGLAFGAAPALSTRRNTAIDSRRQQQPATGPSTSPRGPGRRPGRGLVRAPGRRRAVAAEPVSAGVGAARLRAGSRDHRRYRRQFSLFPAPKPSSSFTGRARSAPGDPRCRLGGGDEPCAVHQHATLRGQIRSGRRRRVDAGNARSRSRRGE